MVTPRRVRNTFFSLMALLAVVSIGTTAVQASLLTLNASQDQTQESSFTFDFGQYGGPRSALISDTHYALQLDETAPPGSSASFLSYEQHVNSIGLPNPQVGEPDLQTGPLTITILQSNGGTYDQSTGLVTTSDYYLIEFTGDLSGLGISSPVILPGQSSGLVSFDTPTTGQIELNWEGLGSISGLDFSYTCSTHMTFTPEPGSLALLGMGVVACIRRRRRA